MRGSLLSQKTRNNALLAGVFLLSSLSAFIYPIWKFKDYFITRDWGLFNSFSLFTNSCWNYYGRIPLQNPYVFGGFDVSANPQARIFSPLTIFDILFSPPYANLLSLVFLGFVGSIGMYKLLRFLKVSQFISALIAVVFVHASWFHLHFAEGHVIFGSFYLFGYSLLFILRFSENRFKIYYAILCAFFLLDGAMYAFIYSQLLFLFMHLFRIGNLSIRSLLRYCWFNKKATVVAFFVFCCLSSMKLLPMLLMHWGRLPIMENITLNFRSIINAFFNVNAHIHYRGEGTNYWEMIKYHEVGTYIGVLSFGLIVGYAVKCFSRTLISYGVIILFFFWIGSGWLDPINPWRLFQLIPVVSNAHIQTRALFIVYLFLIVLLAFALDKVLKRRKIWIVLVCIFLFIEGSYTSFYPYYKVFQHEESVSANLVLPRVINNTTIDQTVSSPICKGWGYAVEHFNHWNIATLGFMDPSFKSTNVKTVGDESYRGEIYFLKGTGICKLLEYTPGEIRVEYATAEEATIQINSNYLFGWHTVTDDVQVTDKDGLITIDVAQGSGIVKLFYTKKVVGLTFLFFLIGAVVTIYFFWSEKRARSIQK